MKQQAGTVVYDSSLKSSKEVSHYLEKSSRAGKKMVIYEVSRHDMARVLAVLRREVEDEDPRVPHDFIVRSAVQDKLLRIECMEVILNDSTEETEKRPEYHFLAGDEKGTNMKEVLTLTSKRGINLQGEQKEALKRLEREGIYLDTKEKKLSLIVNQEKLETYFQEQLEKPVQEIMEELSEEEKDLCQKVFGRREFPLESAEKISNVESLYKAIPKSMQEEIAQADFIHSFTILKQETREKFFLNIQGKTSFSYLDLPLKAALTIHQNLQEDPWKSHPSASG